MPRRIFWLACGCLCLFGLLVLRLVDLQVVKAEKLATAGLAQRSRSLAVAAGRGSIYDRHGLPLADPQMSLDLVLFPGGKTDAVLAADRLASEFGLAEADVAGKLRATDPIVLKTGLSLAEAERAEAIARDVPGLLIVPRLLRDGPSALARHVLGEMQGGTGQGAGIEAGLDRYLTGAEAPAVAAFVDGNHHLIPGLGYRLREQPEQHGFDVFLTISAPWQTAAEAALSARGGAGAAVIVDVETGHILAMASTPEPPQSYLNHAVLAYAPGSLFKVVVLGAALAEKIVGAEDVWPDPEAGMTVREALARSDNEVFQALGEAVGAERLLSYAAAFGLGQRHDIGLPGEESGALPDPAAVAPWDLLQISIGQGPLTLTPLQAAGLLAAIGNDGRAPALRLINEVRNRDGVAVWRPAVGTPEQVVPTAVATQVRLALGSVITEGSGERAAINGVWTGGKTGTAEAFEPGSGKPVLHAWFGGLADLPPAFGSRRLAIVVFLADGASGGTDAAPIFADILRRALPLPGANE